MPQRLLTNNPDPSYHLDYRDGNVLGQNLCTGDDEELYGASGMQLNSAVNNTDEAGRNMWGGGQFSNLFYQRSIYYEAPGTADGAGRLAEMQNPLDVSLQDIGLSEPTGTIVVRKDTVPNDPQDFDFAAGGGLSPASFQLDDDSDPTLPNAQTFANVAVGSGYSIAESALPAGWEQTGASCDDGSSPSNITVSAGETVTCTFTNSKASGYPRPKGATPFRASLVPAYAECTGANRTHGPPLASPSCSPPSQASGHLTVGTPDANGKPAKSVGSLRAGVIGDDTSTSADEADVALTFELIDVRNKSDLLDYTGELEARTAVRITDRNNAPGPVAGTVADFSYAFPVPCSATADTTVGSTCSIATTADSLVPGTIDGGNRSIWELGQVEVMDGGADGLASSGDNTPFARQGIFVP
jgi:hypothetical protein